MLSRWLWQHPAAARGRRVLELGSGVGTAGIAAAIGGADRVILTDINSTALRLASANAALNGLVGEGGSGAVSVAHLDWGSPPARTVPDGWEIAPCHASDGDDDEPSADEPSCPSLLERFPLIIAADVINADGLSEMVYRMLETYLHRDGLFVMVCPKPFHRHAVDQIRALLLESELFETVIAPVPEWLADGLPEAQIIVHEMFLVQWRDGARPH